MKRRIWPVVLAAGLGIAVLCALGTWQLQRLAEKQQLIAEITERIAAEPVSISNVLARDDREFTKVEISGVFDHAHELQKLAAFEGSPGWRIITPFETAEGVAVLVDRGVVPDRLRDPAKRPEGQERIELTAIVRAHDGERGFFDPENDVENRVWHWWDLPAMLASASIPPSMKVAPFVLQALPGSDPKAFPRAAPPQAALRNNHLQYAVTWFALAIVLLVIAGLFIRKQIRKSDA
jgi:surfeit locus 1 family protein